MFQIGDYVVYGCRGIHEITDITTLNMEGVDHDREYYILKPYAAATGSVYAPVDSTKINMRLVMSEDEVTAFLENIASILPINLRSPKQQEEAFKLCVKSCDPDELMRVIKTLRIRKRERAEKGKKLTITDTHYLEQAEKILYDELSLVLKRPVAEIPAMIQELITQATQVPVSG